MASNSAALAGTTCKDSAGNNPCVGTNSPCVCVERPDLTPVETTDFTLDFTDSSNPGVVLISGSTAWKVWSQEHATDNTADNLGDVSVSDPGAADDFGVTIENGNNGGPGAAAVGSLDLSGAQGYSTIAGGRMTGNLAGVLIVKASGGSGGSVNFGIDGTAEGDITAETILSSDFLTIGDVAGTINIKGDVAGVLGVTGGVTATGAIDVDGDVPGSVTVGGGNLFGVINVDGKLDGGQVLVVGDVGALASITIGDMVSNSGGRRSEFAIQEDVYGSITLLSGIKAKQFVQIGATLKSTGSLSLNNQALAGELTVNCADSGGTITAGALSGTATLSDNVGGALAFGGSATFSSVSSTGRLRTTNGNDLSGTWTINGAMAGTVDVSDGITSGGKLDINGASSGTIDVADELAGEIEITGDVTGAITVDGVCPGTIDLDGNLRATLELKDDFSGVITIAGDARDDINIGRDASGSIDTDGSQRGDVDIAGDLTSAGSITIDESLTATGRILVTGLLDGGVSIGTETVALSQITATLGLGSNGCIQVNTSLGLYDANGTMHFGPATIPDPLNDITFDGGIKIWDNPFGAGGDLEGTITVTGCHATACDLDICIDGTDNGTVTLNQAGCTNQIGYSCDPAGTGCDAACP